MSQMVPVSIGDAHLICHFPAVSIWNSGWDERPSQQTKPPRGARRFLLATLEYYLFLNHTFPVTPSRDL